jgi:hypothetical protein
VTKEMIRKAKSGRAMTNGQNRLTPSSESPTMVVLAVARYVAAKAPKKDVLC